MLQTRCEEIRRCYRKAEDRARKVDAAPTEALRTVHFLREQRLLKRTRVHELNAGRLAARMALIELPGRRQTGSDPQRQQNGLIPIVDDDECAGGSKGGALNIAADIPKGPSD